MEPIVDIRNLSYSYEDGTLALDDVSLKLFPGETLGLLGANGSGKTTLALHLNGLLHGSGMVTICGLEAVKANLAAIRRKVGLVFQESDDQLFMPSVLEDVSFGPLNLGYSETEALAAARKALSQVGMNGAAGKAPYHLSAGEKKRVAIAGVLAMDPEILVLDEPTTYLDPPTQHGLAELLSVLPQPKVLVTHDIAFVRRLATRAVFLEKGKVAGEGTVDEVVEHFHWWGPQGPRSL